MPELISGKPVYPRSAPITAILLWLAILVAWILFYLSLPHTADHAPTQRDIVNLFAFVALILGTIVLFLTGLAVLIFSGARHAARLRRYEREEHALAASLPATPAPPPPPHAP